MPTSVAHVTNHRTISRLRQFNEASVMRITFENNKQPHVIRQHIKTYTLLVNTIYCSQYSRKIKFYRYFYVPHTVVLNYY